MALCPCGQELCLAPNLSYLRQQLTGIGANENLDLHEWLLFAFNDVSLLGYVRGKSEGANQMAPKYKWGRVRPTSGRRPLPPLVKG